MGKRLSYTIPQALLLLPSLYSFKISPKTDHCSCSPHHPPWSSHQHLPPGPLQLPLHWAPSFCPNFNYSASHSAASRILLTFKSIHIPPLGSSHLSQTKRQIPYQDLKRPKRRTSVSLPVSPPTHVSLPLFQPHHYTCCASKFRHSLTPGLCTCSSLCLQCSSA